MAEKQKLEDEVAKVIISRLFVEREKITPKTRLLEDLRVDSAGFLDLMLGVEDQFNLPRTPNNILTEIKTVKDLLEYLRTYSSLAEQYI